ncbi:MAG: DUF6282 family protein [Methanobacteriota archaeon]
MISGTIDLHVHAGKDRVPRKMTIEQAAYAALNAGMKAVVFKSHITSTADAVNEANSNLGVNIAYPALVLNKHCGFDPEYVKREVEKGVRIIHMPTIDSLNHDPEDGLTIIDSGGLKDDVISILKIIAEKEVVLTTGHLTESEVEDLVYEAHNRGIRKVVILHPDIEVSNLSLNFQKRLRGRGVYIERTFYSCIHPHFPNGESDKLVSEEGQSYSKKSFARIAHNIRETGVENNILTTDLGQPENLDPTSGFDFFIRKLKGEGFTQSEIDVMTKINPAKLLGLYDYFVKEYVKHEVKVEAEGLTTTYREPVVGFASAENPLFPELKRIVRETHRLPTDFLDNAKTVVSLFIPFSKEVVESNHSGKHTSRQWAVGYVETNKILDDVCMKVAEEFNDLGFKGVGIKTTHHLSHDRKSHYELSELYSDWSQRHVAYICGVGTFGLNNLLITEKGCAGRIGSVILDVEINPSRKIEVEYCLSKRGVECVECVENCPSGALTIEGFDREKCMRYLVEQREYQEKRYGFMEGCKACGKCATKIPCDLRIP